MPEIILQPEAEQQYREFSGAVREHIDHALSIIEAAPINEHVKYIHHSTFDRCYRYKLKERRGSDIDYRIFFTISDDGTEVRILSILHRDEAYSE